MSTILITGGTGLVGTALTDLFISSGNNVIILSRNKKESTHPSIRFAQWDIDRNFIEDGIIETVDFIVHLAGENVAAKRWTSARKKTILNSRVQPGIFLSNILHKTPNKVKAIIAASAIGWYGPDNHKNSHGFTEDNPPYNDFLANVCKQWENAISPDKESGIRLVTLRLGIVLSSRGGALKELMKPFDVGFAVTMGNGKQIVSWIHIDDLCRMILYSIENQNIHGVYNAVSPHPVSNHTLMETLKKILKHSICFSVSMPSILLKLILGEMSIEILKSTSVSSEKILNTGFIFNYPTIEMALKQLVDKKKSVNTQ